MNTIKILGETVGIQRQDMIDRTEEQIAEGLTGAVKGFKGWSIVAQKKKLYS